MNKHFTRYWLPLFMYMILIFYLSSLRLNKPSAEEDEIFSLPDDIVEHLLEYSFLSILSYRAFLSSKIKALNKRAMTTAILFAISFGILDEIHQLFVPTRLFEIKDIVSNSFASFIVCFKSLIKNKKLTSSLFYLF